MFSEIGVWIGGIFDWIRERIFKCGGWVNGEILGKDFNKWKGRD